MINNSEQIKKEEKQEVEENNERGKNEKLATKNNEAWMKPMDFALITYFEKKNDERKEIHTFRNMHGELSEDEHDFYAEH